MARPNMDSSSAWPGWLLELSQIAASLPKHSLCSPATDTCLRVQERANQFRAENAS